MLAFNYRPGYGPYAMKIIEVIARISRAIFLSRGRRANARISCSGVVCASLLLALPFTVAGAQAVETVSPSAPVWSVELEFQRLETRANTLRKGEGYTGTFVDATQYTGHESNGGRLAAFRSIDGFHDDDELRFVIAPFRRSGTATPKNAVIFDGAQFRAGSATTVVYKFNTYRVSYIERILDGLRADGWDFRLGGTLAFRDARNEISQVGIRRNFFNWGPVPLLYFSGSKDLGGDWRIAGDLDAFPAPGGGGLFDGALKVAYGVTTNVEVNAGGRYQVGGATSPAFYNYLRERAAVVGVNMRF